MDMLFFNKLITKSLTVGDTNRRIFEGYLTVEMIDKENEITVVDELMKVLPIWMARGAPISDTHSNRIVGKGINFAKTTVKDKDGTTYPAVLIQGEIFKDYELDNNIWNAMKTGKYRGLSMGGAIKKDRIPIRNKDGRLAYALTDLEHYEVAVCPEPMVPLALITQTNNVAKALADNYQDRGDGTMCIRCDNFGCYVKKEAWLSDVKLIDDDPQAPAFKEGEDVADPKKIPDKDPSPDGSFGMQQAGQQIEKEVERGEELNVATPSYSQPKKLAEDTNGKLPENLEEVKKPEISKNVTGQMSAVNSEDGKRNSLNVQNDPQAEGLKDQKEKSDIYNQNGGTRGSGAYNTAIQGSGTTAQITVVPNEDAKSPTDVKDTIQDSPPSDKSEEKTKSGTIYISKDSDIKINNMTEEVTKTEAQSTQSIEPKTKGVEDILNKIHDQVAKFDTQKLEKSIEDLAKRVKALETPTDLPLKPATDAEQDIGAKTVVPDTYQSNSKQVALDSDRSDPNPPKTDPSDLKMQVKSAKAEVKKSEETEKGSFTETPRPSAPAENLVNKGGKDYSPILKAAREEGYDGLSNIAKRIQKGEFYSPNEDEVSRW